MYGITMEKTFHFLEATLESGNKVAFIPPIQHVDNEWVDTAKYFDQMCRLIIYTPDKVIIRGCLGDAAIEKWENTITKNSISSVMRYDWKELIQTLTIWSELELKFPDEIPTKDLWFREINDRLIESPEYGNACQERHRFYRATKLDLSGKTSRLDHVAGNFELILVFFHVLNAGRLTSIQKIWEGGKDGSMAPKSYIQSLIKGLVENS
jgi:hypothetical protein